MFLKEAGSGSENSRDREDTNDISGDGESGKTSQTRHKRHASSVRRHSRRKSSISIETQDAANSPLRALKDVSTFYSDNVN